MISVLCIKSNLCSFDRHGIRSQRIAESLNPPENLNAGNWVCLGTLKNSSPWEPPVSHSGGSCLSTYLPIRTLHSPKECSFSFQSSGMETLGEK